MPLLAKPVSGGSSSPQAGGRTGTALFPVCANPTCGSGWLRLWRNRQTPAVEGGWTCSPDCTRARVEACLRRELEGRSEAASPVHRHRIPIGLILLENGWISHEQLKAALEAQKDSAEGRMRLGEWLIANAGLDERLLTRALGVQWSCPVYSIGEYRPETVSALIPRLLVDAFGVLPLRVAGSGILYAAFEDRVDRCVTFALERMTGLRVEAGVVDGSEFRSAQAQMLASRFPAARLVEAVSPEVLARALTKIIEAVRPVETRLVRVHDYFWLRLWRRSDEASARGVPDRDSVEDVLCSVTRFDREDGRAPHIA